MQLAEDTANTAEVPVMWNITAKWPLNRYGMTAPFPEPDGWRFIGAGSDGRHRDMQWHSALLTPADLRDALDRLARPSVALTAEPICACASCESDTPAPAPGSAYCNECRDCQYTSDTH